MTVCLAGIYQDDELSLIVVATDRKVSLAGGTFSAEDVATKIVRVHDEWVAMFSGDLSPMVPIIAAIKQKLHGIKNTSLRPFALACSQAYREERRRIIENEVLVDFEIDSYEEYRNLRDSNESLYRKIEQEIIAKEEGWAILMAGFDKDSEPHIFVVSERGKIQYCDIAGFAAIGSGELRALVELSTFRFNRDLSLHEAVYGILSAKYCAESADGVGERTFIGFLRPHTKEIVQFPEDEEFDLKYNGWQNLPHIPNDASITVNLENGLVKLGFYKAKAKQSASPAGGRPSIL